MIIDKIKTYLKGRTDIECDFIGPVRDTCNIDSIVDRYYIKVDTGKKHMYPLHQLNAVNEFAQLFFNDLTKYVGQENFVFEEASPVEGKSIIPKIIYKNGLHDTSISIKVNNTDIILNKTGTYNKQLEIEFF